MQPIRKILAITLALVLVIGVTTPYPSFACVHNGMPCNNELKQSSNLHYEPPYKLAFRQYPLNPPPEALLAMALAESARKTVTYTVKKGDTLYRIAKFFETTVELLMLENQVHDPTKLQIGHQLKIPNATSDVATWLEEGQGTEIGEVFNATLTAYTAGFESTGKTPDHPAYGITSSGAKVQEGRTIAVDPKVIPMGSLVYIDGIGVRRAEDTGSAIKGARIDVYIPDLEQALEFGVKKDVKVYVLKEKQNPVQVAGKAERN